MIAGGLAEWQRRIRMASPAELASLDQQVGSTHPLRPLITDEVVTRSNAQSGAAPSPEFTPVQIPMTAAVATPPAVSDIAIPPVPVANPAAPQAALPQAVPAFYNAGDQQTVRDTSAMMDRIGTASGEVIRDVGGAVRSLYNDYAPVVSNVVDTAGQIVDEWGNTASAAYDKWMPRLVDAGGELAGDIRATLTSNRPSSAWSEGYAEPAPGSTLGAQITGGPTPGTSVVPSPGTMPQTYRPSSAWSEGYPPPAPGTMLHAQIGGHSAPDMQTALIGPASPPVAPYGSAAASPPPAQLPGGPPPPADPSPLSHVSVMPMKRRPDIPVKAPPRQTTKSANLRTGTEDGPSAAEALNRFYADQYSGGIVPGAPATVEDARTMAGMGGLKGAYR